MRPKSIILFERVFLASILFTTIDAYLGFFETLAQMQRDSAVVALGWGAGVLMVAAVLYVGAMLLLDFLIAHRANTVAKWILVLITLLGLSALPSAFAVQRGIDLAVVVLANLLAVAAVFILFSPEARSWMGSKPYGKNED